MPFNLSQKSIAAFLEFKVAGYTIDSLGRRWNPALHPRDSRGRFIETGGIARVGLGGLGVVKRAMAGGKVEVEMQADGSTRIVPHQQLTMVRRPDGTSPTKSVVKVAREDARRESDPVRGDGLFDADPGDDKPFTGVENDVLAKPDATPLEQDLDNPDDDDEDDDDAKGAPEAYTPSRENATKGDLVVLTRQDKSGKLRHVLGKIDAVGDDGRPSQITLAGPKQRRIALEKFNVADYTVVPFEDVEDPAGLLAEAVRDDDEPAMMDNEFATELVAGHTKTNKARPAATARPKGAEGGGQVARPVYTDENLRWANVARGEDKNGIYDERNRRVGTIERIPHRDPAKAEQGESMYVVTDGYGRKVKRPASDDITALKQLAKQLNNPPEKKQDKPAPAAKAPAAPQQPVADAPEAPAAPAPVQTPDEVEDATRKVTATQPKALIRTKTDDDQAAHVSKSGNLAAVKVSRGYAVYRQTDQPADERLTDSISIGGRDYVHDGDAATLNEFRDSWVGTSEDRPHAYSPARFADDAPAEQAAPAPQAAAPAAQDAPEADAPTITPDAIDKKPVADLSREDLETVAMTDGLTTPQRQIEALDELEERDKRKTAAAAEKREQVNATIPEQPTLDAPEAPPAPKKPSLREFMQEGDDHDHSSPFKSESSNAIYQSLKTPKQQKAVRDLTPEQQDVYFESRKQNRPHTAAIADAKKSDKMRAPIRTTPDATERPSESAETTYPENTTPEGAPDAARGTDRTEVLGDVPAVQSGGDERPDGVLRGTGEAGRGGGLGGFADAADAAAEPDAGAGQASASVAGSSGEGDGDGRPGVPAAGAGDGEPQTERVLPAGDGRGERSPARRRVAPRPKRAFKPSSQADLAKATPKEKLAGNLAALRTLRKLQTENRAATAAEQKQLARWAGWGSLPQVFDENNPEYAAERAELKSLLSDSEWAAARRNMLNAHYTDAGLIAPLWKAMQDLGFEGGNVLEPGSGSGNFIGFAPDGAKMHGVELDPITAAISEQLYPDAEIANESFGISPFRNDAFDAVVGNVPFGSYRVADPRDNPENLTIHNHFINKSLRKLKPGGVMAMVTSSFTLDGQDDRGRRAMYEQADLIGAVRLPAGTHKAAAGTDVVTDVLLFRKRKDGEPKGDATWLGTSTAKDANGADVVGVDAARGPQHINDYFLNNSDDLLGKVESGGFNSLKVSDDGKGDVRARLAERLGVKVAEAKAAGKGHNPDADPEGEERSLRDSGTDREGRITYRGTVTDTSGAKPKQVEVFERMEDGRKVPFNVPGTQAPEFKSLLNLRDLAEQLRTLEAAAYDDDPDSIDAMEVARTNLRTAYEAHVANPKFGHVSRFEEVITETESEDGETEFKVKYKYPPVMGLFRQDFGAAEVFALEKGYDPAAGKADPADILHARQFDTSRVSATTTDDPADAIALAAESPEGLTTASLARILGTSEADAREKVRGLVYDDPATSGALISHNEYVSGHVRNKHAAAVAAAENDPKFRENVAALEEVLPPAATLEDLAGTDGLTPGASYMEPEVVQAFARHLMGRMNDVEVTKNWKGHWQVNTPRSGSYGRSDTLERETWGTPRVSFYDLFEKVLKGQHRLIKVMDTNEDGSKTLNKTASDEAMAKAAEILDEFTDWVFANPKVADRITSNYTELHRSRVPRSYDGSPERAFEGMTADITLRPHQRDAVTRAVNEPAVLFEHVVGAGKTYTLAASAMELRRLGMAKKPVLAVPGHMLAQWTQEFRELYPNAKILAADDDLFKGKGGRKRFSAIAANNDWDVVVMTYEAFEKIPVSPDGKAAYLQRELDKLRDQLQKRRSREAENGGPTKKDTAAQKQMETAIAKLEAKIADALAAKEDHDGIDFETIGFDYVMVDEFHNFKNLGFSTNMDGVQSPTEAARARDMHMKLENLRAEKGANGKIGAFATGTPISNTLAEMYTMTRMIRPDLLEEIHAEDFDSWAATFAKMGSKPEMDTAAGEWVDKVRMRGFTDALGDGLRIWRTFSDTKTADDLNLPRPTLKGGARIIHAVEPSEAQLTVLEKFKDRVSRITGRPKKGEDTHVAVIGDGRRMAIDPRIMSERGLNQAGIDPDDPTIETPEKILRAASNIFNIWQAKQSDTFKVKHDSDEDAELAGALQMVMIDTDAPKKGKRSSYQMLKDELVALGMPAEQIRFIQETAGSNAAKARLFEDARQGKVSVLMGSTASLGTGTNVQNRLYALHHLDSNWKPSDIEQREGRILRQGNQYGEVEVHAYVTKRTHDVKTWDMIAYKQAGLDAIANGTFDMRGIDFADDVDPLKDYDTLVGAGADNPLIEDRRNLKPELDRLRRAHRSFTRTQARSKSQIRELTSMIGNLERRETEIEEAIAARTHTTEGENFKIALHGSPNYRAAQWGHTEYTDRKEAAAALAEGLKSVFSGYFPSNGVEQVGYIGQIGGLSIHVATSNSAVEGKRVRLSLSRSEASSPHMPTYPLGEVVVKQGELANMGGVLSRLENRINKAEDALASNKRSIDRAREELEASQANADKTFKYGPELEDAERRSTLLDKLITGKVEEGETAQALSAEYEEVSKRVNEAAAQARAERAAKVAAASRRTNGGGAPTNAVAQESPTDNGGQGGSGGGSRTPSRTPSPSGGTPRPTSDAPRPETAVEAPPTRALTPVEKATIRNAVTDEGPALWQSPIVSSHDDVARYLSEGHLAALVNEHGLNAVWEAVKEEIDTRPDALDATPEQIAMAKQSRTLHADSLSAEGEAAISDGDLDRALALLDEIEQVDPTYLLGGQHPIDTIRKGILNTKRKQASAPASDQLVIGDDNTGIADADVVRDEPADVADMTVTPEDLEVAPGLDDEDEDLAARTSEVREALADANRRADNGDDDAVDEAVSLREQLNELEAEGGPVRRTATGAPDPETPIADIPAGATVRTTTFGIKDDGTPNRNSGGTREGTLVRKRGKNYVRDEDGNEFLTDANSAQVLEFQPEGSVSIDPDTLERAPGLDDAGAGDEPPADLPTAQGGDDEQGSDLPAFGDMVQLADGRVVKWDDDSFAGFTAFDADGNRIDLTENEVLGWKKADPTNLAGDDTLTGTDDVERVTPTRAPRAPRAEQTDAPEGDGTAQDAATFTDVESNPGAPTIMDGVREAEEESWLNTVAQNLAANGDDDQKAVAEKQQAGEDLTADELDVLADAAETESDMIAEDRANPDADDEAEEVMQVALDLREQAAAKRESTPETPAAAPTRYGQVRYDNGNTGTVQLPDDEKGSYSPEQSTADTWLAESGALLAETTEVPRTSGYGYFLDFNGMEDGRYDLTTNTGRVLEDVKPVGSGRDWSFEDRDGNPVPLETGEVITAATITDGTAEVMGNATEARNVPVGAKVEGHAKFSNDATGTYKGVLRKKGNTYSIDGERGEFPLYHHRSMKSENVTVRPFWSVSADPTAAREANTETIAPEDLPTAPSVDDVESDRNAIAEAREAAEDEAREGGASPEEVELAGDVAAADEATKDAEVAGERPVAPEVAEPKTPRQLDDEDYPLSEQQQPVADLVVADRKDALVEAKAGAGKTSTLVAIAKRFRDMDPSVLIGYIAFNKSVQTEAQGRFPRNTETRTGHSVSFAWAGKKFTDARFKNPNALRNSGEIARHLGITKPLGDGTVSDNARDVMRAVGFYSNSADDKIGEQHFVTPEGRDLLAGFTGADKVRMQQFAQKAWDDLTAQDGRLNTNNDHIRKMWALSKPDFSKPGSGLSKPVDVLFLDEAQDTPPVLAKVIADQSIQKVIVGDGDQAIYGFTGAIDFLDQAEVENRLPLTKSYRFGPQVADWGNRFLQVLGSKQRVVGGGPDSAIVDGMDAPDAILTRSNGGMFDAILGEQEAGRTVGVPTGTKADLRNLIGSARYLRDGGNAPQGGMHEDIAPFNTWQEFKDAVEKGDDQKLTSLDRLFQRYDMGQLYDIVENLIEEGENGLDGVNVDTNDDRMVLSGGGTGKMSAKLKAETGSGIGQFGFRWNGDDKSWTLRGSKAQQDAALARLKEALGGDARKPDVTVSTAHKAKGLEWGRVRIGDDFRGPEEDKQTGELKMPDPEELRLAYVAVTRAEKELDLGSLAWVRDYSTPNGEDRDSAPVADETIDAPEADAPEESVTLTAEDLVADDVTVPQTAEPAARPGWASDNWDAPVPPHPTASDPDSAWTEREKIVAKRGNWKAVGKGADRYEEIRDPETGVSIRVWKDAGMKAWRIDQHNADGSLRQSNTTDTKQGAQATAVEWMPALIEGHNGRRGLTDRVRALGLPAGEWTPGQDGDSTFDAYRAGSKVAMVFPDNRWTAIDLDNPDERLIAGAPLGRDRDDARAQAVAQIDPAAAQGADEDRDEQPRRDTRDDADVNAGDGNDGAVVPPVVPTGDDDEDDFPERPVAGESDEQREQRRKRNRDSRRRYDPSPSASPDGEGAGGGLPTPLAGAGLGELPLDGDADPAGAGSDGSAPGGADEDLRLPDGRRLGDLTVEELGAELNTNMRAMQAAMNDGDMDEASRLGDLGDAMYRVAERQNPDSVLSQVETDATERHPDFGKRIGEVFTNQSPNGGIDLLERVGGRNGEPIERLLYRVEKRDGAWGVYGPNDQSPALFVGETRGQAFGWAEDRANGVPEAPEAPEAPEERSGGFTSEEWNGGNPSNLPPLGSPVPVSPALAGELEFYLENGEQDGIDQGYTLTPNRKGMLVHDKAKALSALDAIEDIKLNQASDGTPGALAVAKAAGARKKMVRDLPDATPQAPAGETDVQHGAFGKVNPEDLNVGDRVSGTLTSTGEPGELRVESVTPDGYMTRITGTRPDGTRDYIKVPSGYQTELVGRAVAGDITPAWERPLEDLGPQRSTNGEPVMDTVDNLGRGDVIEAGYQGRRGRWVVESVEGKSGMFTHVMARPKGRPDDRPTRLSVKTDRPVKVIERAPESPEAIADREAEQAEFDALSPADQAMVNSLFTEGPTLSREEAEAQAADVTDVADVVADDVAPDDDFRPELLADGTLENPLGLEAPADTDDNYSAEQLRFLADEGAEVLVNADGSDEWLPGIFERVKDGVAVFRWSGTSDTDHGGRYEWPVESIAGIRGASRLRTLAEEVDPSVLRPGTEVAVMGKSDKGTYRGVLEGVSDDGRAIVRLPNGEVRQGAVRGTVRPVLTGFRPGDEPTADERLLAPTPGVWTANGDGLVAGVQGEWVAGIQPNGDGYEWSIVGFDGGLAGGLSNGFAGDVEDAKGKIEDAFYVLGMNGRVFSTLPGADTGDRDRRSNEYADNFRKLNETSGGASDGAAEAVEPPADVNGATAEWVPTGEVTPGDVVRVDGDNGNGSATTHTGHALGTPEPVTVGGGDGKPDKGLQVTVGDDTDGLGDRQTVLAPESSLTARVPRTGEEVGDNPQSAYESQVLSDKVAAQMPLDRNGLGIFPGATVVRGDERGQVLNVWDNDVEVRWAAGEDSERVAPGHLSVHPDLQARRDGWTAQGKQLEAGDMVGVGNDTGVVQSVTGDEAEVLVNGTDLRTIGAGELQVIGKVSDPALNNTAAPAYDVPPSIEGPDVRPAQPVMPADLPEGAQADRVVLKPEHRAALEALGLDTDSITPIEVQEAAARVRHDMPITAEQASDLAAYIAAISGSASRPPASKRQLQRVINRLVATVNRLNGGEGIQTEPPSVVTAVKVSDLTRGDMVAIPNPATGEVEVGHIAGMWPVQNGQVFDTVLALPDGTTRRHNLLPDGEAYLLPDLDADLGTLDADEDDVVKFVEPQVGGRAVEAGELTVEAAIGDAEGATSIEDLADKVLDGLDSAAAQRDQVNSGRRNKADMERAGLTPEQVQQGRDAAETAADAVQEEVAETILNTLDDAEPLPGETPAEAADRVRDLLRDADSGVNRDAIVQAAMARHMGDSEVYTPEMARKVHRDVTDAMRADLFAMADTMARLGELDSAQALSDAAARLAGRPDEEQVQKAAQAVAQGRPGVARRMASRIRGMFSRARAAFGRRVAAIYAKGGTVKAAILAARAEKRSNREVAQVLAEAREAVSNARDLNAEVAEPLSFSDRVAFWRNQLPGDSSQFGKTDTPTKGFRGLTLARLRSGEPVVAEDLTGLRVDRAADGGPGETAMKHYDALMGLGAAMDDEVHARVRGLAPELGEDPAGAVLDAIRHAQELDREQRGDLGDDELAELRRKAKADAEAKQRAYHTAKATATREALALVRPMGSQGAIGLNVQGRSDDAPEVEALQWAEQFVPTDWLSRAGTVEAQAGRMGSYADGTITVAPGTDGLVEGSGRYGGSALHGLAHHLETTVPGITDAAWMHQWAKSSTGPIGARKRRGTDSLAWLRDLYPAAGFSTEDGAARWAWDAMEREGVDHYEWLPAGFEALFGDTTKDDDLRQWMLGLLAYLGRKG